MYTRPNLQHRKATRLVLGSSSTKTKQRESKFYEYGNPKRKGLIAEVYFRTDEHILDKQDKNVLDLLIEQYQLHLLANNVHFTFNGHADYRHTDKYNENLSKKRALSVQSYICTRIGSSINFSWKVNPLGETLAGRGNLEIDRRVDILSSYTPSPTMPSIKTPPKTQKKTVWKRVGFWADLFTGDIFVYKKLRGDIVMRINQHPNNWYAWNISASLGCVRVPIKGSLPIGAGSTKTTEQEFFFNPELIDPRKDWREKKIFVRIAAQTFWIKIEQALQH